MAGHKTKDTATGCVGTVSWVLGDTGKMLVVMYSAPYDHNLYSNWLAVGIFKEGPTDQHYQRMYNEHESHFKRKEFYYNTDKVEYSNGQFKVTGSMGTSHHPSINVPLDSCN